MVENKDYQLGGGADEVKRKKDLMAMMDMNDPGANETLRRWTESAARCTRGCK